MGYEFQIHTNLSDSDKQAIGRLLESHDQFHTTAVLDKHLYYRFHADKSREGMSDFEIIIEEKGIYICRNTTSNLWHHLAELKYYLELNHPGIRVEEL